MTHEPVRPTVQPTGEPAEPRPDVAAYRLDLVLALRLKDVPGDRIGELVAEVESHVAETGEDPVEAFGPAREYAAGLTGEHRPPPVWHTVATIGCAFVAGWFLAQGVLAMLLDRDYLGGPGWAWAVVGLLVAVPAALRVRARSSRVLDPRTGADLVPGHWWEPLTLVALPVGIVLVAFVAIRAFSG